VKSFGETRAVDGVDLAVRGLVSLTGQLASVDEGLTGRENLILLGPSCSTRSDSPTPPTSW
jgi:hypothetical protein